MRQEPFKKYDVLVVGGGNAALCAAITAREQDAEVLLLERAPRHSRGGNSRHTRNIREALGRLSSQDFPPIVEVGTEQVIAEGKGSGGRTIRKLSR